MSGLRRWPEDGLEFLLKCPVCSSVHRVLLHAELSDICFSCAPGEWTLYQCRDCAVAYLDPRPSVASIHLAYANYYTHKVAPNSGLWLKQIWRAAVKSYHYFGYGARRNLRHLPGFLLLHLMPGKKALADAQVRHLPRPMSGQRLLDVGCGNGDFLRLARDLGWRVSGVDFDPRAVEASRKDGLDVLLGGIEIAHHQSKRFDVITLSHVLEHVHDPRHLLMRCRALLKPTGLLWIDTPNIGAQGYQLFGAFWRGLEVPRHLVLFSRDTLEQLLLELKFQNVEDAPYRPLCRIILGESEMLASDNFETSVCFLDKLTNIVRYFRLEQRAKMHVRSRELLTLIAFRGSASLQDDEL